MIANHPFARRGSLNPLDDGGQPGCAVCGRPPASHRPATPSDLTAKDERIANLEAGREVEQTMLINAAGRIAWLEHCVDDWKAEVAAKDAEIESLREFVEHVAAQQTILIGNPYGSLARQTLATLTSTTPKENP